MPSHLRNQASLEHVSATVTYQTTAPSPLAKPRMSLTQTYYVASTARTKLGREAARADHNLRRLVGHANLLDTLMVELADAEREQEAWFHQAVQKAAKPEQPRHVQWIDTIAEVVEEELSDDDDADSDFSDSDSETYDEEMFDMPLRRIRSPPVQVFSTAELPEDYDDEDFYDEDDAAEDDEDDAGLTLTRTVSKHALPELTPPELTHDSDSESDDDSMPSSPEQPTFTLSDADRKAITTTSFYNDMQDLLLPQPSHQPLIAAC